MSLDEAEEVARRVVALLGEHDLEAAAGGVAGDCGAVDAAADDEHIEALR